MKFTISDGNYDYLEKTEEFISLYNNHNIRPVEIRKQLNLTINQYNRIRNKLHEENRIKLRRQIRKPQPKKPRRKCGAYYTTHHNGKYTYYHVKKGGVYYCLAKTEEQAKMIVERLKECDWDKKQVRRIKEEVIQCQMD